MADALYPELGLVVVVVAVADALCLELGLVVVVVALVDTWHLELGLVVVVVAVVNTRHLELRLVVVVAAVANTALPRVVAVAEGGELCFCEDSAATGVPTQQNHQIKCHGQMQSNQHYLFHTQQ